MKKCFITSGPGWIDHNLVANYDDGLSCDESNAIISHLVGFKNFCHVSQSITEDSEIFPRIFFSRIALKDTLVMRKIRD